MRLVLRNYLSSLKEEGELDKICVEMLEGMGLTVHASAQKGTRQYGVDVLASGKMPGSDEEKVYALIIKCKNIGRSEFYKDGTGISTSIRECLDVYIHNFLPDQCRGLPFVICVVCGGEIMFEVRENLSAVINNEFDRARQSGFSVDSDEWPGDRLASMLVNSLQNSNLLVSGDKRLLFRSLALAHEPQESFSAFREFVRKILDSKRVQKENLRLKALREVNLSLAMLIHECEEESVQNYETAWLASEYVYLMEWEYVQQCKKENCYHRKFDSAIEDVARMYCKVAESYIDRVSIFSKERYGFALAVNGNDELDVILKFYDVLGKVSSFGLYILERYKALVAGKDECECEELIAKCNKVSALLVNMLTLNPVCATPILDSQSTAISATVMFLSLIRAEQFVGQWLDMLIDGIGASFKQGYGYPVNNLKYEDLLEHAHAPVPKKKIEELLFSSELIPVLALSAILNQREDIYEKVKGLVQSLPRRIDYQLWFLDEESDGEFFVGERLCGSQLCSLDIENREDFIAAIELEVDALPVSLSCHGTAHSGLVHIGCRHYGFPVPGNILFDKGCFKN